MAERKISLDDEDDVVAGSDSTPAVSAPTDTLLPVSWKGNIEFINHLTLFNNVLISVLADKGAGKSTFMAKLQEGIDGTVNLFCTQAATPFKPRPMMTEFVKRFNLKVGKKQAIADIVAQINERKIPVLMVIDGAEVVSDEWLSEVLTVIAANKEMYFHLCLISDFSMAATLNALEANFNNLIHTIELGGLNEDELKPYVAMRYPDEKCLENCSASLWHAFFEETGGKIARVNDRLLPWFEELKAAPPVVIRKRFLPVWAYASVGALAIVAALGYQYRASIKDFYQFGKQPEVAAVKKVTPPQILKSQLAEIPLFSSRIAAVDIAVFENVKHASALPMFTEEAIKKMVDLTPMRQPKLTALDADEVNESMVVMDKVVVIPKPKKQKTINHAKAKHIAKPVAVKHAAVKPNYKYTIQLAAGQKLHSLEVIIKEKRLKEAKIKTISANGAQWYVLVYGQFSTRHEAENEIARLARLNGMKPWVRALAGLKAIG